MKPIETIKQIASDQKFVDDLAVEHTPRPTSFWSALRSDRKLAKLSRSHDRRLTKTYGVEKPGTDKYRGTKIYARFCAWADLYPDEDIYDTVWPAVKAKLDTIVGND